IAGETPFVVVGSNDTAAAVQAMKAGAMEYLAMPIDERLLERAVADAIAVSAHTMQQRKSGVALRAAYDLLSARERDVMGLVVGGLLNKQVGWELGISEITVKAHRGRVMRKMNARTFADLVRMGAALGLAQWRSAATA